MSDAFDESTQAQADYEKMLKDTAALLNKLLVVRTHYQTVYWKRQRDWTFLAIAVASARTRLETVMSADTYIRVALDRWSNLVRAIENATKEEWARLYKEQDVLTETLACLFLTPDIEENPHRFVRGHTPMAFFPGRVLEKLVSTTPEKPDDLIGLLLDRDVRRLCCAHKALVSLWGSLLEAANWWRVCASLDPRPEDPDKAKREALSKLDVLRLNYRIYLETFSAETDQTDDADDYEVRAEIVRQGFKFDALTYHRSLETMRERQDKIYRIAESRQAVLK